MHLNKQFKQVNSYMSTGKIRNVITLARFAVLLKKNKKQRTWKIQVHYLEQSAGH